MFDGIQPLTSADQPTFAKARAFAAHCFALCDSRGLLPAAHFDLVKIHKLAPYVVVLGTLDEGADFEVRLAGTRVVEEFLGRDMTGAKLSQVLTDDEFGKRSWHIVREVLRSKRPVINQPGRTRLAAKSYMKLETINFPLVDEAGAVIKIAVLYDFVFEKEPAAA